MWLEVLENQACQLQRDEKKEVGGDEGEEWVGRGGLREEAGCGFEDEGEWTGGIADVGGDGDGEGSGGGGGGGGEEWQLSSSGGFPKLVVVMVERNLSQNISSLVSIYSFFYFFVYWY